MKMITSEKSVIHGTLRAEDLIPAFLQELKDQEHPQADEFQAEWDEEAVVAFNGRFRPKDICQMEYIESFIPTLMDALDELAGEGLHFGSNPGNLGDLGFWKEEEEL